MCSAPSFRRRTGLPPSKDCGAAARKVEQRKHLTGMLLQRHREVRGCVWIREVVHPNRLGAKLGFVEQEHIVGTEFPRVARKLVHVANELATTAESEPSTFFPGPIIRINPNTAVTSDINTGHDRKKVGHGAFPA